MDKETIRADIIREIADLLFLDEEEVSGDMSMTEDLGVDSLEMQELYGRLSKKYQISLNLIRIINDTAIVVDNGKTGDGEKMMEKVSEIMNMEFSREDIDKVKGKIEKGSTGRLLETIQGFVTVDMLAGAVEKTMLRERGSCDK
ncbi:MAG: acyl carrier protein [Anaerovoracaceae bacterium]|jgi:acyl carrier protein